MNIHSTDYWHCLQDLDTYLCVHHEITHLTQDVAVTVARLNPSQSPERQARRYASIRQFADFLIGVDLTMRPLDPYALHVRYRQPPADILTWAQIEALMQAVTHFSPQHAMVGTTLRMVIGLAACTGMRLGEIVALNTDAVDLTTGVIHIRLTKFSKSRMLTVHESTCEALRQYVRLRDLAYPRRTTPAFFVNHYSRRISRGRIDQGFVFAARACGLRGPTGPGPHFHSLRHTYAVRCLERWYREGREIMPLLPILATYMGHAHYTCTAYYITAAPELLALGAQRLHAADWFTGKEARP
jgi:integrase